LRGDAVALLIRDACARVPPAAVQLLEARPHQADLLGLLAGGRHDAEGNGNFQPLDDVDVAHAFHVLQTRRRVAIRRIDVGPRVGRLRDVRVGGDDRIVRDGTTHDAAPPASTRPGSGPLGSTTSPPSSRAGPPFTTAARMPAASDTRRSAPAGKSHTRRRGLQPTVSGSKITTSAARPGARRPRSVSPKTAAGWPVRRWTPASSESTPRSRTQVPSSSVGAQASHSWLACAP